jgi:acyl-CoA synthetase (NDP forming)
VCVISAGFAEVGGEGRGLQDELRRRARGAGVRLIGPNCMGLLNGGPDPRFNASVSTAFPPPGRLAFVSQSGGLGLAALALFTGPSLGVGSFVSVGNTADLTSNDLLLYWDEDPAPASSWPTWSRCRILAGSRASPGASPGTSRSWW